MKHFDLRIYMAHAAFWLFFAAGHFAARHRSRRSLSNSSPTEDPPSPTPLRAPRAKLLIGVHMVAFALLYTGIERAVFRVGMPAVPAALRSVGGFLILLGGALMCWARLAFASWRFRAQIDLGHRLATGGPFRFVRHPIYLGMDLLGIGTCLWIPTPLVWLGAVLMVVVGDLRARAEELLLERAFGDRYIAYRIRTRRFIPGVY
jgi:protein-S-isoprenylcysteine O-methyltransferase Ste14